MKIFVYNYREFDEAEYFEKFSKGVSCGAWYLQRGAIA